ncbi:MAG: hypothetical protein WKF88_09935 [Ferruginibacter sp.]
MKFVRILLVFLTAAFIFSSCQKELSLELGNAKGTLKEDASGDCLPVLINGSYQKDTLLKPTNYVDIQVDITESGSYIIKSDTVNGYTFSATGAVSSTGLNTIRLLGSGRPINPGLDVFKVKFDTSICEINIVVTGTGGGGGGTAAVYTLGGSPGTCTGAIVSGTYMQGLILSPANTATVDVNVTTPGTYTLTSGPVNGVSFSGVGSFAAAGPNTITLTGSGTPTAAGPFNYPLTAGTSNCTFTVTYATPAAPATYNLSCTTPVLAGTYQAGTAMNTSNTLTVGVNVTAGGSYSITSTVVNGILFIGSGVLAATPASQTVTLTATGTPTAAGTFSYPLSGGGSTCTVPVTFIAGTSATDFINCNIDGVAATFNFMPDAVYDNTTVPGFNILDIFGSTNNTSTSPTFEIGIATPIAGPLPPGTYSVNQTTFFVIGDYNDAAGTSYTAQTDGTTQTNPFTVVVTSSNTTRISGTFSGTLKLGGTGAAKIITGGTFSVPVN